MLRLRHILHPIRHGRSLLRKVSMAAYTYLGKRQLSKIRRGHRDQCWCGGELLPFKWFPSYGVCVRCGCYVSRRPPLLEEFKRIYSIDGYWGIVSKMRGWPTLRDRASLYKADGRLDHWLRLVAQYGPSRGVVIEIGCAPGVLLAELQRRGYKCIGVEVEDKVAQWISSNMNLDVRVASFPSSELQLPNCDLCLALDVLEHVPSPDEFVQEISRLLRPGGIAIIQTPIDRYLCEPPFADEARAVFDDREHLVIFVDKAMKELAALAGLEVVSLSDEIWHTRHEICVYRKPPNNK